MSKRIRQASLIVVVAMLLFAGYTLSSNASTDPAQAEVASVAIQDTAETPDVEAQDVPVPQATCAAIRCLPGKVCVNVLECTPAGDCFHVGRCVSPPSYTEDDGWKWPR